MLTAVMSVVLLASPTPKAGAESPDEAWCPTDLPTATVKGFFLGRGFVERAAGSDGSPWMADYDGLAPEYDPIRPAFMRVEVTGDELVTDLDLEATLAADSTVGAWSVDDLEFAVDTWFDAADAFVYTPDFPEPGYGRITRSTLTWPTFVTGDTFRRDGTFRWEASIDGSGMHLGLEVHGLAATASGSADPEASPGCVHG